MKLKLKIWRQENATAKGSMQTYSLDGVSPDMSFLEMMDVLNEQLMEQGIDPVAFDHDCERESAVLVQCLLTEKPMAPIVW